MAHSLDFSDCSCQRLWRHLDLWHPVCGPLFSTYTPFPSDLVQAQGLHTSYMPLLTMSSLSVAQTSVPNSGLPCPPVRRTSPAAACPIFAKGNDTWPCLPIETSSPETTPHHPASRTCHPLGLASPSFCPQYSLPRQCLGSLPYPRSLGSNLNFPVRPALIVLFNTSPSAHAPDPLPYLDFSSLRNT